MRDLETMIREAIRDGIIRGATVVSGTPDAVRYQRAFGFAHAAGEVPMTTETVIDMASVTKALCTITALLILHRRGQIDFDAPFTEFLPEYTGRLPQPLTVRQLANHQSGFYDPPDQAQRSYFAESGARIRELVLALPPPSPPPATHHYSCWNYLLLSLLVEAVSGRDFAAFCREEIFLPLGMTASSLGAPRPGIPPHLLAQTIGTAHPGEISDFIAFRCYRDGVPVGNAGLFASAGDLGKLLCCYLRHGQYAAGRRLFGEAEFAAIAPDRGQGYDGYRRFGWVIVDAHLPAETAGQVLLHSGWSGQTVLLDLANDRYGIVLTTRCGDYERAKTTRFEILRAPELN